MEFKTAYKFQDDKEAIQKLQKVSSDSKSDNGYKTENGLLIGTKEWFKAIEDGLIKKETVAGRISKVYMSGHNDWPEFEIESDGEKSSWTREGIDTLYEVGKKVELSYVLQKYKRPWDLTGPTAKQVMEIKIEK